MGITFWLGIGLRQNWYRWKDNLILYNLITECLQNYLEYSANLGTIVQVTISKDDNVILDGAGQKKSIKEWCEQIKSTTELSTSNYDKEKLQERLAKISEGVAEMHV
ncbi:Chaperonin CPN60-1, mitochondrial [Capsicum chinense]|nr:Chaperonin CPN60-1, mitochondrial [Capsicum chinense]